MATMVPSRMALPAMGPRTRWVLIVALLLSLAVHFAFTFWPASLPETPDSAPLAVTLTEMPAPPAPVAIAVAKPKPRPKRATVQPPPVEAPAPATAAVEDTTAAAESGTAETAGSAAADAEAAAAAAPEVIPGAMVTMPVLPPRVDLAYDVYYGTLGFLIGEATYRFEHTDNQYKISTVGRARGLAALILRGQGKVESRGLITATGLQPLEFNVERGGPDRRESALFDWEAGIVTMHGDKTAALDLPTFDPMTIMWQFYFTPPTSDVMSFSLATPRRMTHYTVTREDTEKIEWAQGTVDAERWHRRSDDGKTDAYVWLAPALRYIPVKMRVVNTDRGTLEVLLSSIKVDEGKVE
ncbi:MAG: DUF3108 domain-containing protein [Betaproteobacteria bacterium]